MSECPNIWVLSIIIITVLFVVAAFPNLTIDFRSKDCISSVGCYTTLPRDENNRSIHCNISYGKPSLSDHLPGSPIILEVNSSTRIPIGGFKVIRYEVIANFSLNRTVIVHGVTAEMNRCKLHRRSHCEHQDIVH